MAIAIYCVAMVHTQNRDWAGAVLMCMCGMLNFFHIEMGMTHYVSGCDATLKMIKRFSTCVRADHSITGTTGRDSTRTNMFLCLRRLQNE